jgi:hypothetical protein
MPFCPEEMTLQTFKKIASRLEKTIRKDKGSYVNLPTSLTRASALEWTASIFGFDSWDVAREELNTRASGKPLRMTTPSLPDPWALVMAEVEATDKPLHDHTLVCMTAGNRAGFFDWLEHTTPEGHFLRIQGPFARPLNAMTFPELQMSALNWWITQGEKSVDPAFADFLLHSNTRPGYEIWQERARYLVEIVSQAFFWMRDVLGNTFSFDDLTDWLLCENVQKLSKRRDLPPRIIFPIRSYLRTLPGHEDGNGHPAGPQHHACFQREHQHIVQQIRLFAPANTKNLEENPHWALPGEGEPGFEDAKRFLNTFLPVWLEAHPGTVLIMDGLDPAMGGEQLLLRLQTRLEHWRTAVYLGTGALRQMGLPLSDLDGVLERALIKGTQPDIVRLSSAVANCLGMTGLPDEHNRPHDDVGWMVRKG